MTHTKDEALKFELKYAKSVETLKNTLGFAALVAKAAVAGERQSAITAIQNIERKGGWITREDAINAIRKSEKNT